jgi:hypothetical protein
MNILVQACFYPYQSDVCAPLSVPEAERALYPILSHELSLLHRRPLTSDESNRIDLTSPQREKSPMTYMPVTRTLSLLGCSQREIRYILENLTTVVNTPLGRRFERPSLQHNRLGTARACAQRCRFQAVFSAA